MRRRGFFWAVFLLIIYFTAPFWGWRHSSFAPITVPDTTPAPSPTAEPAASQPYHAVWVSYLEWQQVDFSSAQAFSADIVAMFDNIADLGATVVLAQVRPFGDALYPSDYYPFSHLCTGTQGQGPGFDPLALLVQAAHARGLQLEAWINPYRLQSGSMPLLCAQSPALLHPEWTKTTSTGLYLNPASAEVRAFISDAVAELCHNYDLDGIHFDDYFYPTTDPAFDADDYAAAGTALSLDDWRRQNVNALMALCYRTAHQYGVRFGAAPIGDPDRSYADQYSDAALWLAQGGYVKPNTPQLAMIGDNRHQGEIVAPEDKMQAMVDRAVSLASGQNMTDQYLLLMIDLLKRIIEVIEKLDLTVKIDIRDIRNALNELEKRSGYKLRTT